MKFAGLAAACEDPGLPGRSLSRRWVPNERQKWVECKQSSVAMQAFVTRFLKNQSGSSAVEYAVIAAIIGLGIIASVGSIRDGLNNHFNNAKTELSK